MFRTQLTWYPLERVCHQPPHLVASSETSYVKASSLPSSLISAHTCFLPSFENDQFCLDDSGTMGYFGKKALLWLARVCVSATLQGRKRMWPSLIMAPELSCFLQLQMCPYEWPFMLFSTELKSPFLPFLYKFSAVWAGNKSYLNHAVLYVALVGPNSQIQECIDV